METQNPVHAPRTTHQPHYQWLLFDADGTLFDFEKTEVVAFQRSVEDLGYTYQSEYLPIYQEVNKALWDAFERGEVAQDVLKVKRFADFFEAVGLEGDATEFSQRYVGHLAEGHYLLDGAEELAKTLAQTHRLIIITNGLKEVQRPRFEKSSIHGYFEAIIVSGEVGAAKPGTKIFDAAFEAMGNPVKSETLIIGDSLTSDMAGGINYGIDTCWYNPDGKKRSDATDLTYEIRVLDELVRLLSN